MFWILPLLGAAAGALSDKEDPVRGALTGAGIGMTGGAAAGALGAGAAGAGAAAGAGTAAGTTGGLLAAEGAAGAASAAGAGAGTGGLLAEGATLGGSTLGSTGAGFGTSGGLLGTTEGATMLGTGSVSPAAAGVNGSYAGVAAEQAAAPVVDRGTQAGVFDTMNANSGGALDQAGQYGKKGAQAYNTYQQAQPEERPAPVAPPVQNPQLDLSPILNDSSAMQQYTTEDNARRKKLMEMYAQQIRGY